MDLEEHTLDEPFADRCEVCGTALTASEIDAAREAGGPFLCTVHAAEESDPAAEDATVQE